ncbi:hypothetical protein GOODEAATRI_012141 [Goodea atripinnis]|uniref:Uncharacterized protein n=1 Tax=Goodea atripinnis TaxID=208336 RepID=A0ABV0MRH2_9TELE
MLLQITPPMMHSHMEAFSEAPLMFLAVILSSNPLMPSSLNSQCTDYPRKPLQPTSIGSQWMASATVFRICHGARALWQQLSVFSREPHPRHSGHAEDFASPQQCRFDGLGRTSYTDWIRNLSPAGSDFHSSARADAFQFIQASSRRMAAVLLWHPSSTSARICPWT